MLLFYTIPYFQLTFNSQLLLFQLIKDSQHHEVETGATTAGFYRSGTLTVAQQTALTTEGEAFQNSDTLKITNTQHTDFIINYTYRD